MRIAGSLVLLLAALSLGGCQMFSATRVEGVTSQAASRAVLRKPLVVGITVTPEVQSSMEREFARQLGTQREVLLASRLFPGEKLPLRDEVVARVREEGVTGVLAVRLLSYEVGDEAAREPVFSLRAPERVPGTRVGWTQEPWVAGAAPARDMPVAVEGEAVVETRLYDVATGEVVWEARTRTRHRGNSARELEGFVFSLILELRKGGWL